MTIKFGLYPANTLLNQSLYRHIRDTPNEANTKKV